MRQAQINVHKFKELSNKAKERAINDLLNSCFYNACVGNSLEWVIEDFKEILQIIGYSDIEVYYSGFYSQGDGASFKARFEKNKEIVKNLKKYCPKDEDILSIARQFKDIKLNEDYYIEQNGCYCHEYTMHCDNELLLDLSRKLAINLYNKLKKEYENLTSVDSVAQFIEDNEFEFYTDGAGYKEIKEIA